MLSVVQIIVVSTKVQRMFVFITSQYLYYFCDTIIILFLVMPASYDRQFAKENKKSRCTSKICTVNRITYLAKTEQL